MYIVEKVTKYRHQNRFRNSQVMKIENKFRDSVYSICYFDNRYFIL